MTSRPQAIGRYQIQRILGQGAMGTVYLAQDPLLMRLVAVKVLRDPGDDRSQILARFQREAVISAKLNHPHVITIFDVGEDPERGPFMAMEYVDGVTLANLIRDHLPLEQGLRLLSQTMGALVAAEAAGIAHRDVKPENILVSKDWRVKLMDFGIARSNGLRMTQGGRLFGTPYYTAPEVLAGSEATSVADRYAFFVTAFEVITGALPFQGASIGAAVYAIVHEPPIFPETMRPALRKIFERALAKEPATRYPDLLTFMEALVETVDLPDASRTRLRHSILEVRAHAVEPPMGVTQSLEDPSDIHTRPTAPGDLPVTMKETLELPPLGKLPEELFEGPSYQTIAIPAANLMTFASHKESTPRLKEKAPTPVPEPTAAPSSKVDTRPVPVLALPQAVSTPSAPGILETQPIQIIAPLQPETVPPEPRVTPVEPPPPSPSRAESGHVVAPNLPPAKPAARKSRLPYYLAGMAALGLLAVFLVWRQPPHPRQAQPATVRLSSVPRGAVIYLDDQRIGTTPLEQPRTQEAHLVRMELPGYQTSTQELRPDQDALTLALRPMGFAIAVNSDPSGADVFLNGQFAGTTPIASLSVPKEGQREITLRLPGYSEWKADVDPDLPFPERILMNPLPRRKRKR